jgi:glycosyltransferase involved in cell wall biosynthesis
MATTTHNLGIGFGEVQHFHDGLGEFSRQFGLHLASRAPELADQLGVRVHYHLPERFHGMFGDQVSYLPVNRQQRHWHNPGIRFDVWHNLHQLIRQRPPMGTRHCITTLHDLNMVYAKQGFSRWRALRKQVRLLRRADEIVCISDYVLGDLRKHTALRTPATRIYNGVQALTEVAQEPIAELVDQGYLFHIGRMTPNKNVGVLIELAAAWPEQTFVFVGPRSGHTEGYRDQAQARGLRNVRFFFDVSEGQKAWLYAHCQGLLFPSITEGFGLPPIEAMYFGRPVFLSKCTSLPEIGGPVARFFDTFSPDALREVIESDRAASKADADARCWQRQAWAAQFGWPACTDNYVKHYLLELGKHKSI